MIQNQELGRTVCGLENGTKERRGIRARIREQHPILSDIQDVLQKLQRNQQQFDMTDDDDLIEALIFEQNSLWARYNYLLRSARQEGITLGSCQEKSSTLEPLRRHRPSCSTPSVSGDF